MSREKLQEDSAAAKRSASKAKSTKRPSTDRSLHPTQIEEGLVNASVVGKFGVEGGGHDSSLADRYRIFAFGGEDFHVGAEAFNFWGTDEDHFERRGSEPFESAYQFAFTDRAVELAPVGITADADVDGAEAGLLWIFNFRRQQDCARAGAEGWLHSNKLFEPFEAIFSQQFQERAGLAAGDHEAVDLLELFGFPDEHNGGAQLFKPAAVGIEIALQRQDSDFHADLILPGSLLPG